MPECMGTAARGCCTCVKPDRPVRAARTIVDEIADLRQRVEALGVPVISLGIDPASVKCGYGIIRVTGDRLAYVDAGVVSAPAAWSVGRRLKEIGAGLREVLAEAVKVAGPGEAFRAGIESGFVKARQSELVLAEARGMARFLIADQLGIETMSYAPATIKLGVTGSGKADKQQVAEMVRRILGMRRTPSHDAGDALAVAVTRARDSR